MKVAILVKDNEISDYPADIFIDGELKKSFNLEFEMQMLKPNYLVARSLPSELIKKLRDLGIIFVKLDSIKELEELNSTLEEKVKEEVDKNRQKEFELMEAAKMVQMGEMIGNIAHQWRQPLNSISTSIQNLKYDFKEGNLNDEKFINKFIKGDIEYKLLGVEHIPYYPKTFVVIFCLGVLYHRSDPIATLKQLKQGLSSNGEAIIDTFIIEGDDEIALTPKRYAKMRNVYFIPTIKALQNWAEIAKFKDFELLEVKATDTKEQRKTEWIDGESLNNFLNEDGSKTIEGYPPPIRAYVKLKV